MITSRRHTPLPLFLLTLAGILAASATTRAQEIVWMRAGETSPIRAVHFLPGTHDLLSASADGLVRIWDAESGELKRNLFFEPSGIRSLVLSPDGRHAAIGTYGGSVKIYDMASRKIVQTLGGTGGVSVNGLCYSRDGGRLAGATSWMVLLWDLSTGDTLRSFRGHTFTVNSAEFSPDGKRIVSASDDFTAKVWDAETGMLVKTLQWRQGRAGYATYSPDGRTIVSSAGTQQPGRVFDAKTFAEKSSFMGYDVRQIAFAPNNGFFVCGWRGATEVGAVTVFTPDSAHSLGGCPTSRTTNCVAVSSDSRLIAGGTENNRILVCRVSDLNGPISPATEITVYQNPVRALAVAPDGTTVAAGDGGGILKLWSTDSGRALGQFAGGQFAIRSLCISHDGRHLASASEDGAVKLWEMATRRLVRTLFVSSEWPVNATAFTPDDRRVVAAIGNNDSVAMLFDTALPDPLLRFTGHGDAINAVAITPDGAWLATAGDDRTIRLYPASGGASVTTMTEHTAPINALSISSDSRLLASASDDNTIRIWEIPSGDLIRTLHGHARPVTSVAFSKDGRLLFSASLDSTARVWSAEGWNELHRYDQHAAGYHAVAAAADSLLVFTAGSDASLVAWKLLTVAASETPADRDRTESALTCITPNPARGATRVDLWLARASRIDLRIVDVRGVTVGHVHQGVVETGARGFIWDASSLPAGVYRVVLHVDGRVESMVLNVVR